MIAIIIGFVGNSKICGIISSVFSLPSRLAMLIALVGLGKIDYAKPTFYNTISNSFLCAFVNSVTLSLMAIDRQDCVLRPFNRRMTPSNVKFIIPGKWIGALVLTSVLIVRVFFTPSLFSPVNFFSQMT